MKKLLLLFALVPFCCLAQRTRPVVSTPQNINLSPITLSSNQIYDLIVSLSGTNAAVRASFSNALSIASINASNVFQVKGTNNGLLFQINTNGNGYFGAALSVSNLSIFPVGDSYVFRNPNGSFLGTNFTFSFNNTSGDATLGLGWISGVGPAVSAEPGLNLTLKGDVVVLRASGANALRAHSDNNVYLDSTLFLPAVTLVHDLGNANFIWRSLAVSNVNASGEVVGTIQPTTTGTTLKQKKYLQLTHAHMLGTSANSFGTVSNLYHFGHGFFDDATDQASNFVDYRFMVPTDIDTTVALRAKFFFALQNTDTGTHRYVISYTNAVASQSLISAAIPNIAPINLDFAGDGSGAVNDLEIIDWTTLTGWAADLVADRMFIIRLARDGDSANDGSTVDSVEMGLFIEYGSTQ